MKGELKAWQIPYDAGRYLIYFFDILGAIELVSPKNTVLKRGTVVHFCKRNLSPRKAWTERRSH